MAKKLYVGNLAFGVTDTDLQSLFEPHGKVQSAHPGYGMGIAFALKTDDERKGVQQLIDYVAATTENV